MQAAAGVVGTDRRADLEQHWPCIQASFHLHHGDARFAIAGLDRPLDRRGPAPARQQRGVTVDAAEARNIQHHLRQNQTVGHHHQQVGLERRQFGLGGRVAQGLRLVDGNLVLQGQLLDRAGHQFLPAAGGAIRLGVDRDDLIRAVQ